MKELKKLQELHNVGVWVLTARDSEGGYVYLDIDYLNDDKPIFCPARKEEDGLRFGDDRSAMRCLSIFEQYNDKIFKTYDFRASFIPIQRLATEAT